MASILPNGMDGVGGLTQPYIKAGETAKYEWTLRQYGTFMFHSHHDEMTQMGMGLIGMFVVHPRNPSPEYRVDRDFSLMISEWAVKAGTARPNTLEMTDFNVLTINGKVFPSTAPLVCRTGDQGPDCASAIWAPPTTTRCTSTGITSASPRPTVRTSHCRPSGRKRRCWSRWARRGTSSSSPTRPATGPFIAT